MRSLILWHNLGAYLLQIWGVGGGFVESAYKLTLTILHSRSLHLNGTESILNRESGDSESCDSNLAER